MKGWRWLASTEELQEETYGYHYPSLRSKPQLLASHVDWNQTAAVQELAEVREEFSWKPWATDDPFVNRDRVRDEVIDVLHFLGNILVAIGVNDDELERQYMMKQDINRARASSGSYSAKKGHISEGSDAQ